MVHSAAIATLVLFAFLALGSTASLPGRSARGEETVVSSVTTSRGHVYQMPLLVGKSYETLGLVFASSVTEFDENGQEISSQEGIIIKLLREAHNLGADDILNLRVDENVTYIRITSEEETPAGNIRTHTVTRRTVTHTGSALAIKYLDRDFVIPVDDPER